MKNSRVIAVPIAFLLGSVVQDAAASTATPGPNDFATPISLGPTLVRPAAKTTVTDTARPAPPEFEERGSAELAGALVLSAILLRAARRRGII